MAKARTSAQRAASRRNLQKARAARQSAYRANATGEMPPKPFGQFGGDANACT